mmetsp:Transcript_64957/g.164625  ORF Transcript_64957/g.164625 Transcript_64957/m.164625 type:complete len:159 (-) Transcript_64957:14-490(-)
MWRCGYCVGCGQRKHMLRWRRAHDDETGFMEYKNQTKKTVARTPTTVKTMPQTPSVSMSDSFSPLTSDILEFIVFVVSNKLFSSALRAVLVSPLGAVPRSPTCEPGPETKPTRGEPMNTSAASARITAGKRAAARSAMVLDDCCAEPKRAQGRDWVRT